MGRDGLSEEDKWNLGMAELARVLFLQQNAFSPVDASFPPGLQKLYLSLLIACDAAARDALARGVLFEQIARLPVRAGLLRLRELPEESMRTGGDEWIKELTRELEGIEVIFR